ncbi:MAG: flagellar biosynthesis protein FlhB [Planctomycetota bacterium]
MADEDDDKQDKTEDATPRKRQEAREQGQVPLSTETIVAVMLCLTLIAITFAGGGLARAVAELIESTLAMLGAHGRDEMSIASASALVGDSARSMLLPCALVIVPIVAAGALSAYAQIGVAITPKAISWNLTKLNPLRGLSRLFNARSLMRAGLSLMKIVLIGTVVGVIAWQRVPGVVALTGSDLGPWLAGLGRVAFACSMGALITVCALAAIDLLYQRWQHERDLRMSRKDLKNEAKSNEADPQIKARVRQVQRELARRRMMSEVPKATVVVTNPTHYAVALRYEAAPSTGPDGKARVRRAPYVVAKGVDHVAQRIKEVARDAGVLCYEDIALARALHAKVDIGDEIPETFYQAVAGVLAYVYRVQGESVHA